MGATASSLSTTEREEGTVDDVVQSGLIVLDRQHVIGLAGADGGGNLFLTTPGIDGDDTALQDRAIPATAESR